MRVKKGPKSGCEHSTRPPQNDKQCLVYLRLKKRLATIAASPMPNKGHIVGSGTEAGGPGGVIVPMNPACAICVLRKNKTFAEKTETNVFI